MRKYDLVESAAWTDFFWAAPISSIETCGVKVFPVGGTYATIASEIDVLAFNRLVGLGINEPIDERVLDIILNKIEAEKVKRFFIQLHPEIYTDDIRKLLVSKNFYHYNNWVRLIRGKSSPQKDKTELQVRSIGIDESEKFAEILVSAFEWPEELILWIAAAIGRNNWYHYMAFENDIPVATAAFYLSGKYAWFDFAATRPQHRGKGAQGALLAKRIEDCREFGVNEMIVETAEQTVEKESPSYRNVLNYGFKEAYKRPNFIFVNK